MAHPTATLMADAATRIHDLAQRVRYLEDRLRIIAGTARINAQHRPGQPDCPPSMLALYIEQEAAHALAGHTNPTYGVDCPTCTGTG